MSKIDAVEQKLDDLKETVVSNFERNSEQHKQIFEEQKKTNGSIINHEVRLKGIEDINVETKNMTRLRYGLLMTGLCTLATITTTVILKYFLK